MTHQEKLESVCKVFNRGGEPVRLADILVELSTAPIMHYTALVGSWSFDDGDDLSKQSEKVVSFVHSMLK